MSHQDEINNGKALEAKHDLDTVDTITCFAVVFAQILKDLKISTDSHCGSSKKKKKRFAVKKND